MVAIDDFSRMVSRVYGAAAALDTWDAAMAEIRAAFDGLTAALIESDGGGRTVKSANLPPEAGVTYVGYYRTIDYVLQAVEHSPVGLVRGGRELIALQPHSEFDADWMRPHNLTDGLFVRLSGSTHTTSFLVAGDRTNGEFENAERSTLLGELIPHLQQALRTERSLRTHSIDHEALKMITDTVNHGVVALDLNSTVVQHNRAASQIFGARDGLELRAGHIRASDTTVNSRLARAVAEAVGSKPAASCVAGDSVLCPRPSGLRPYVLHVVPATTADRPAPSALVVIIDPENLPEPPITVLRRLFGLTHAEALVATAVLRGDGLRRIAEELSLSLSTVKTHLQHVFDKTDTHRQAELVRLLMSITP